MSKATHTLLAIVAATGLALAPVAAQANTRAGDNGSLYTSSQVQPGAGRSAEGEAVGGAGNLIALFLVALWAAGIVVIVADLDGDDDDNQSPGAN